MKNRVVLAGIASIVALAIIAFAIAAASDDDDDVAAAPTPTATTPAATPTTSAQPTRGPDQPVSATPGAAQPTPPTIAVLPSGRHAEPAPIDGLEMLILESFPPQYVVHIQAGLPSGCAQQYKHEVLPRTGNVIQIVVLNSLPDNTICTAIYGMYELNVNLGSDFTSGQTYTVRVNGREVTFKPQ